MSSANIVWAIGGLDPTGGAGILADQRMIEAMGSSCHVIVSALTTQNHNSCTSLNPTAPHIMQEQAQILAESSQPGAIKIGLLATPEQVKIVAKIVSSFHCPIIVDPVLATSSGFSIEKDSIIEAYRKYLLPHTSLLTPNLPEAQVLFHNVKASLKEPELREVMRENKLKGIILKGGHQEQNEGDHCVDLVCLENESFFALKTEKLEGYYRGTGCHFAAGIAAALSQGESLKEAIVIARSTLADAMDNATMQEGFQVLKPLSSLTQLTRLAHLEEIHHCYEASPDCGDQPLGLYPIASNLHWLERFLKAGVKTAQLRLKDQEIGSQIKEAVKLAERYQCRLFINDYWQEAIKWGAYGVHLGQEDLDEACMSDIKRARIRLGISTHCYYELARALFYKPSYVALGPIFHTTCKSMAFGPRGIDKINQWVNLAQCPVVAIGGLKPKHAQKILDKGASGIAVISDITTSIDPEGQMEVWQQMIHKNKKFLSLDKDNLTTAREKGTF